MFFTPFPTGLNQGTRIRIGKAYILLRGTALTIRKIANTEEVKYEVPLLLHSIWGWQLGWQLILN